LCFSPADDFGFIGRRPPLSSPSRAALRGTPRWIERRDESASIIYQSVSKSKLKKAKPVWSRLQANNYGGERTRTLTTPEG
jgi:hypothetical protein